ncbi:MAG: hypothetical protein IJF75_06715 [Clostridia bacterium]|nr:hypothetical protein [Clostridia bacterium]
MKNKTELELLVIIAPRGYSDKITESIEILAHFPAIVRSKGTAPNDILSTLGIGEPEKDLLLSFCERKNVDYIYQMLEEQFELKSKQRGIAFTIPVSAVGGNVTLQILLGKTRNLI